MVQERHRAGRSPAEINIVFGTIALKANYRASEEDSTLLFQSSRFRFRVFSFAREYCASAFNLYIYKSWLENFMLTLV